MRLLHYSRKPVTVVRSVPPRLQMAQGFKPNGLWVSIEGPDDWLNWCRQEGFNMKNFVSTTEITLHDQNNVKIIKTVDELREFSNRWSWSTKPNQRHKGIPWSRLAEEYQGIIIAPYQHECRFELFWYYGWDCASGCIWDASAVRACRQVPIEAMS